MKKKVLLASLITASSFIFPAAAETETPNLKILVDSTTGWVRNFNPWIGGRGNWAYESLVIFDMLDSSKIHYWLATDFEMAEDLESIYVDLREGVKWSDGEDFTADDVIFTFEYAKKHPEIDMSGLGESVKSIEKLSDHAVRIHLTKQNAFAAYEILGDGLRIVPKHIWSEIEQPAQNANINPVGTGPFTEIQRFTPQVYIQCRNPHYWNDDLSIDCLEFPQYSSNDAALEMLSNGEIDWAGVFIPDIEKTYVKNNPHNKYWFPSGSAVRITMNYQTNNEGAKKAFANKSFRQAFNLAMDRDAMMMVGAYGYVEGGNPASALPSGLWSWRDETADSTWADSYQYDLARAKMLLKEAGFVDNNGNGSVDNIDGSDLHFRIQVPSGWTDWVNNAAIAVEGLREIGINATVITPEVNAYAQNWQTSNFDACFCAGADGASIWRYYDFAMHSRYANSGMWWSTSMHNYINPELDHLIDQLSLTLDPDAQREIVHKIENIYADDIVQVPLYNNGVWYLYNDSRFEGFASEEDPFIYPAPFEGMNRIVHVMSLKPKQ